MHHSVEHCNIYQQLCHISVLKKIYLYDIVGCLIRDKQNKNQAREKIMERIITNTSNTSNTINIYIAEEMNSYVGAQWGDIAREMIETITSASKQAEVIVFSGEKYKAADVRRNFEHVTRSCDKSGQFDFRRYYTAGKVWAFSPELHEIFESFDGFPDSSWSNLETGRIGALKYDAQKGQLIAITPGAIAKHRIKSYVFLSTNTACTTSLVVSL